MFHSKITQPFPQKSYEFPLKLTDLWITSLFFELNINLLMGASLLALAMVAEHSHKTAGQICAAISKKKRKKIIFLQK